MHRHIIVFVCLVAISLAPRTSQAQHTFSGFVFGDVAPRAIGAGVVGSWKFGSSVQLGWFADIYSPYANPDTPAFEGFALLHVASSLFVARLHLGVGSDLNGAWAPRGFLILTMTTRVAPWVNVYASVPTDHPANTYVQTRIGGRVTLSARWSAVAYIEVPLAPVFQLPFVDHENHVGVNASYTF